MSIIIASSPRYEHHIRIASRDEQQKRQHALDSLRVREYSAVAQAYARNQPRTIQNIYIVWR